MSVPQRGHFRLSALSHLTVSLICLPKTRAENYETDTVRVALKYFSPEQLATDEHKAAQQKAFSPPKPFLSREKKSR